MKKMKRILCFLLAVLLVFTGVPVSEGQVKTVEAASSYELTNYGNGSGFEMDCMQHSRDGLAATFAQWFDDTSQSVFYRVTTGDCTAAEANSGSLNKVKFLQASYKPNSSEGSLKNGVFTPYRRYWNPQESGTYKVWKMTKQSDGVYRATDENCISFDVKVFFGTDIVIEGISAGNGKILIDGKEYTNGQSVLLQNGINYSVSAVGMAGYKIKSITGPTVTGRAKQTIKAVYEPAVTCTYEVKNEGGHGVLTVDGKVGSFIGAAGVEVTIAAQAHNGWLTASQNLYANTIKGIYVNGEKLTDITFNNNNATATAKFTPDQEGEYAVSVEYDVNELIADTSKVFTYTNSRSNYTSIELFEHVYGESLKQMPEEKRPTISQTAVTYLAGQRYKHGVGQMNWVNYDCWLKFSDNLPADYQGFFGDADKFHESSNPKKHLFGGLGNKDTDVSTEKVRIAFAGNSVFTGKILAFDVKVSRSGMTVASDTVAIAKTWDAFERMKAAIDAKFRGNGSNLFTYTDEAGVSVDQSYINELKPGESFKVVVAYPGDNTYGPCKRTVTVNVLQDFGITVADSEQVLDKTYDGTALTLDAENGSSFAWTTRGAETESEILYYDAEGNQFMDAPIMAGNYIAKIRVSDVYGSEVSEAMIPFKIHPVDSELELLPMKPVVYGETETMNVIISKISEVVDPASVIYSSDDEEVATVDENGIVTIVGAGAARITATLPAGENYSGAEDSVLVVVEKATPVLNFAEVEEKTYGDEDFALIITENISESDNTAVTYHSQDTTIANMVSDNGTVEINGGGDAVIIASLPETDNYYGIDTKIAFHVNKAEASVTIEDADKAYDGKMLELQYTTENTYGNVAMEYKPADAEDTAYVSGTPTDAGSYVVRVTIEENNQYQACTATKEVTIAPVELSIADLELQGGGSVQSKIYDGTNEVQVTGCVLEGVVGFYGYVYSVGGYDWTYDDVRLDINNVKATVASAEAGEYDQVSLSNIALIGEDAENYVISENAEIQLDEYSSLHIEEKYVSYEIEDQTIAVDDVFTDEYGYVQHDVYVVDGETKTLAELIDQSKYKVWEEDLLEGHKIGSVTVSASNCVISMEFQVVDEQGNDVTENYAFVGNRGMVDIVINCDDHAFDDNGFCPNCVNYESAKGVADEYGQMIYDIYNAGQLFWFAKQVNDGIDASARARLMADIDLNPGYIFHSDGTVSYKGETVTSGWRAWTPIGLGYTNGGGVYSGNFDGQGHLISGVYLNMPEKDAIGLFGWIDYNPTVKDLHLTNSYIKGKVHVGAVGGYFYANMESCTVDTTVTVVGESMVGGFAGYAGGGEIKNCASAATVISTREDGDVAGLVAQNSNRISNSFCTADKLVVSNNESYGGSFTNCFYLDETGNAEAYEGTTAVTAEQFASGEVAYLLQAGQKGAEEWDNELQDYVEVEAPAQIWGQNIDLAGFTEYDPLPVLHGPKVYVTSEDEEGITVSYTNLQPGQEEEKNPVTEVFHDVSENDWFADEVQYVYDKGIMTGTSETTFEPNTAVTRATIVQTLYKLEGKPAVDDFDKYNSLNDTLDNIWWKNALAWALNTGVAKGDSNNHVFNPDNEVTREDLATFIYRYAQTKGICGEFEGNVDEILGDTFVNSWARTAFAWAIDTGLIKGKTMNGASDLAPQVGATRAELATIMMRFYENNDL